MSDSLDDVKPKKVTVFLGGKDRTLKFAYSAWATLEGKYGDITAVMDMIATKPFAHLPSLIAAGIVSGDGEVVTESDVKGWLDELEGINDLMDVLNTMKDAIMGSLPKGKGKKNPPKGE